MKEIKDMNLAECLDALRMETLPLDENWSFATFLHQDRIQLADRIHDLTRWIPLSERMPEAGEWVLVYMSNGAFEVVHESYLDQDSDITHWKQITAPEDKP
jgi:hypothetical protein